MGCTAVTAAIRRHFPFAIGQHAVQFYEREERLADTLAAFLLKPCSVEISPC